MIIGRSQWGLYLGAKNMLSAAQRCRCQSKWEHIVRLTASSFFSAMEGSPRRYLTGKAVCNHYNQPLSGNEIPRSGGIATMFRLPYQKTAEGLDACFVGIPLDTGTSNRSGARLGPRQIRTESCLIRLYNSLGAAPFESIQVADIGDVNINLYDLKKAVRMIKEAYSKIVATGCKPLTLGGDHTLSYPVLQAVKGRLTTNRYSNMPVDEQFASNLCTTVSEADYKNPEFSFANYLPQEKHGTVGLVHIDAHGDTSDEMLGEKIAHGTPFHRAIEEELLDPRKMVQIGLRGPQHTYDDTEWQKNQGVWVVRMEECHHKSLLPLMSEVRQMMGDTPVYISFDIDGIDPGFAPGTGTPEVGGLTPIQGMEIIRGCRGLNIIGGDLVEVSPPYDPFGTTALLGANLLFEMLCVLPGVKYPSE